MMMPSGFPVGVKNPALMAAMPLWCFAAAAAFCHFEPGPFGWSAMMR